MTFAAIAAVLVIDAIVTYAQWRSALASVNLIERNIIASVRLLGRMAYDIERERVLLDRHVFERERERMVQIEAQLAAVKADYAAAAMQYAPLATFDQEAAGWLRLTDDVDAADRTMAEAITQSRANRDDDAIRIVIDAEPVYDAIARDTTVLLDINQLAGREAREHAAALESTMLRFGLLATAVILALTLTAGWRVTRTIAATEDALRERTSQLEDKNRELDAFAGRIAHDLRGPLNTISLATAILAERVPDEGTTKIVRRGIAQMTNLVEDLLGLSRVGALEHSIARVAPVAAQVEGDLRPMVAAENGTLRVEVEPASVQGSESLLRQVLWNLGENAFKYRRPDTPPEIEIRGAVTPRGYEVHVRDNGLGMTKDESARAFEPFFRGERTRSVPGTGLGLAIVRRVVEASGGTIAIDSEPGRGTTFTIVLPVVRPVVHAAPAAESHA